MPTPRARYEELLPVELSEAEAAVRRDDPEELYRLVISVALHGDPTWAEPFVTSLACHPDPTVRGNAVLSFGHLARLHGRLELEQVLPLVRAALDDRDQYVRSHADSARDDIEHFLKVRIADWPGA